MLKERSPSIPYSRAECNHKNPGFPFPFPVQITRDGWPDPGSARPEAARMESSLPALLAAIAALLAAGFAVPAPAIGLAVAGSAEISYIGQMPGSSLWTQEPFGPFLPQHHGPKVLPGPTPQGQDRIQVDHLLRFRPKLGCTVVGLALLPDQYLKRFVGV